MVEKSFYDLDYIIEINEARVQQFESAYQKVSDRFTNIILIYSGVTIFLVPIIQDIFLGQVTNWLLYACFLLFAVSFLISLIYSVRLLIPVEIAYPDTPKKYYNDYRLACEAIFTDKTEVKMILKASYIDSLEYALEINESALRRKKRFYYKALVFALLCVIPYVICIGFHISKMQIN